MRGSACYRCGRTFADDEIGVETSLVRIRRLNDGDPGEMLDIEQITGREAIYYCLDCLRQ